MKKIIILLLILTLITACSNKKNTPLKKDETLENITQETYPNYVEEEGIFSKYYKQAYQKVMELTLEEKISQLLLVQYPASNATDILKTYPFGGYLFFSKDFQNKTKDEVINMINNLQNSSKIPILTAVDEEGGVVVRISSNSNLRKERFSSPSTLYQTGGLELIKEDTIEKSNLLKSLGINLNLAPVVDVATNPNSFMYNRTIGQDSSITSEYAKTVIESSHNTGVSYTLKHFPGYGNNKDTHTGSATDDRSYEEIVSTYLPPFKAGIAAGAESILVSHNIVTSIDENNPASLSEAIHKLLKEELNFTGIIITDDLSMGATSNIDDAIIQAILAGNDLMITANYEHDILKIKEALNNNLITEEKINQLATKIIAWKYYKELIE